MHTCMLYTLHGSHLVEVRQKQKGVRHLCGNLYHQRGRHGQIDQLQNGLFTHKVNWGTLFFWGA